MDSEGPGAPSGTDFVVQNRTGTVCHATVRCQTSTSTIFSEMIELDSGKTVAYDDLPQELIELQVTVADGPKGSKMYDAETVTGTIAVGVTGSGILFETTADPVTSAAELDDVFDDGGIDEASTAETAEGSTDGQEREDADAATGDRKDVDAGDSTGESSDGAAGTDTADADRDASGDRAGGRAANAGTTGSETPDASGTANPRSGSDADADAAGSTGSDDSAGSGGGSTGGDARTADSDPSGTDQGTAGTTTSDGDDRGPGPDEVHCRNCGEIIRANAEICPECGTQNAAQASQRAGRAAGADDAGGGDAQSTTAGESAADDSGQGPGPDEIYCRNCGEIIRERAEICPECGVENVAQGGGAQSGGSGGAQPSQGGGAASAGPAGSAQQSGAAGGAGTARRQSTGSEPSGSWVNGVRVGALLWFLALVVLVPTVLQYQNVTAGSGLDPGRMLQSFGLAALLPPIQLLAWIVLPLSLYFDLKYVDYHVDQWPLSGRLYIAGAAILPVLTQVLGAAALFVGSGGAALAAVVPVLLLALSIRHLRTRSRLV